MAANFTVINTSAWLDKRNNLRQNTIVPRSRDLQTTPYAEGVQRQKHIFCQRRGKCPECHLHLLH